MRFKLSVKGDNYKVMELLRSLDSVRFQPFHQRTEISSIVGLEMDLRMSWDCSEKVKIQQTSSQGPS